MNLILFNPRTRFNITRITLVVFGAIIAYNGIFLTHSLGILDTPIFNNPIPIFNWATLFGLLLLLISWWIQKRSVG